MELQPHITVDDALQILDPEGARADMDRHATGTTGEIRGANGSGSLQWDAMRHGIAGKLREWKLTSALPVNVA